MTIFICFKIICGIWSDTNEQWTRQTKIVSVFYEDTKWCFENVFTDIFAILVCLEISQNISYENFSASVNHNYNKMKALLATVISLALTTVVIGNAYYQKKQFYPSIVYLTNSNPSMAVSILCSTSLVLLELPKWSTEIPPFKYKFRNISFPRITFSNNMFQNLPA